MKKAVVFQNRVIQYDFQIKKVKNINLRIKSDGTVHVSANQSVSEQFIDAFVLSKAEFILKVLERNENNSEKPQKKYFEEEEIQDIILALCQRAYPYYQCLGIKYPQIKFRKMVSRWGSCHPAKGILTFNINLMYAPKECIEYVVLHEFTHFLHGNHSSKFYEELEKVCPDWKLCRNQLKEIRIR